MSNNLYFDIYIDKGTRCKANYLHLKSYMLSAEMITDGLVDELFRKIIEVKGDWLDFRKTHAAGEFYCEIVLMFHEEIITKEQYKLIGEVLTTCERFFTDHKMYHVDVMDEIQNDFHEDRSGFLISVEETGGSGSLRKSEIDEILNSQDLNFSVLSETNSIFSGGASGGRSEFVYFIISAIASGITWDVLKVMIKMCLPRGTKIIRVENKKFNVLRRTVAGRILVDERDLVLTRLNHFDDGVRFTFRAPDRLVFITCNEDYEIRELQTKVLKSDL